MMPKEELENGFEATIVVKRPKPPDEEDELMPAILPVYPARRVYSSESGEYSLESIPNVREPSPWEDLYFGQLAGPMYNYSMVPEDFTLDEDGLIKVTVHQDVMKRKTEYKAVLQCINWPAEANLPIGYTTCQGCLNIEQIPLKLKVIMKVKRGSSRKSYYGLMTLQRDKNIVYLSMVGRTGIIFCHSDAQGPILYKLHNADNVTIVKIRRMSDGLYGKLMALENIDVDIGMFLRAAKTAPYTGLFQGCCKDKQNAEMLQRCQISNVDSFSSATPAITKAPSSNDTTVSCDSDSIITNSPERSENARMVGGESEVQSVDGEAIRDAQIVRQVDSHPVLESRRGAPEALPMEVSCSNGRAAITQSVGQIDGHPLLVRRRRPVDATIAVAHQEVAIRDMENEGLFEDDFGLEMLFQEEEGSGEDLMGDDASSGEDENNNGTLYYSNSFEDIGEACYDDQDKNEVDFDSIWKEYERQAAAERFPLERSYRQALRESQRKIDEDVERELEKRLSRSCHSGLLEKFTQEIEEKYKHYEDLFMDESEILRMGMPRDESLGAAGSAVGMENASAQGKGDSQGEAASESTSRGRKSWKKSVTDFVKKPFKRGDKKGKGKTEKKHKDSVPNAVQLEKDAAKKSRQKKGDKEAKTKRGFHLPFFKSKSPKKDEDSEKVEDSEEEKSEYEIVEVFEWDDSLIIPSTYLRERGRRWNIFRRIKDAVVNRKRHTSWDDNSLLRVRGMRRKATDEAVSGFGVNSQKMETESIDSDGLFRGATAISSYRRMPYEQRLKVRNKDVVHNPFRPKLKVHLLPKLSTSKRVQLYIDSEGQEIYNKEDIDKVLSQSQYLRIRFRRAMHRLRANLLDLCTCGLSCVVANGLLFLSGFIIGIILLL